MYTDNEEFLEDFADALDDHILPSGSGINSDWDISYSNDARTISCSNAYDHMNEVGFYDATIPFKVDIPVEDPLGFSLTFTGDDMNQAFAEEDDLGSYLEDVIAYSLDNHAKEIKAYADEVGQRGIDIKEDVIMESMKIMSENRHRSEKEAAAIRSRIEKEFDASKDYTPRAFLYKVREMSGDICKSLNIAPPVRRWSDFVYAGLRDTSKATIDLPKNAAGLLNKSISVEQNDCGYACVRYSAARNDLAAVTKSKIYADDKLIGAARYHTGDEMKTDEKFTVYGQGPLQDVLKKEFEHINDTRSVYGDQPPVPISIEPESRERFPGAKRLIDDFKKSGGKEIPYTQSKEAGIGC